MKPYKPVFWPVPVFVRDELKTTKRGKRAASNYGLWIVISKNAMERKPWILEQEKYESRYWVTHPWRLIDFYWLYAYNNPHQWWSHKNPRRFVKAAAHLASVECQSRAQEIRARIHPWDDWNTANSHAKSYARSIYNASNYPFFKAAGWSEEDVYNEIIKWL